MARVIDLNALEQPTLELTFRDTEKTKFRLLYPTEKVVERFISASGEVKRVAKDKKPEQIKALYELLADMVNCNMDGFVVSAEELRDRYKVGFLDLTVIFKAYLEFINELSEVKN